MRKYLPALAAMVVVVASGPALAQMPTGGIDQFTQAIWDFMIQNVGLCIIGLALIGALFGAMAADPGRGVGRAVLCGMIGAVLGSVPAIAEWVISLGGA